LLAFIALIAVVLLLLKLISSIVDKLEKKRMAFRKGATGEAVVGSVLEGLPDSYGVIHDLKTSYGNIDHLVIGPTGVYVIDSKNWRGTVTADGSGELLLNGRPTRKPEVKNFLRRLMGIKDKLKALSTMNPYLQGVFAFGSAYVDVRWGTTRYVHCITEEKLYEYIVENKSWRRLSTKEVVLMEQAVLALARMDKGFEVSNSERLKEGALTRTHPLEM
jgi:hypothetical protein